MNLIIKTRYLVRILTDIDSKHCLAPTQTRQHRFSYLLINIMVLTNTKRMPLSTSDLTILAPAVHPEAQELEREA